MGRRWWLLYLLGVAIGVGVVLLVDHFLPRWCQNLCLAMCIVGWLTLVVGPAIRTLIRAGRDGK
jgi:hypothetical protein